MNSIISLHLLVLIVVYASFAYITLRHRFFLSDRKKVLITAALMLLCWLGSGYLPHEEADAPLTMRKYAVPLTYLLIAVLAPVVAVRGYRQFRDLKSGKTERDRLEIRR